jgi:YidC/Oxa1 family membrane protein insertase
LDTKRLLLAAALSMGVLFAWQLLFPPPTPPVAPESPEATASPSPAAPTATPAAAPQPSAEAPPPAAAAPVAAESETLATLENRAARATFSNRGAVLTSFVLKDQPGAVGGELEMVVPRGGTAQLFTLVDAALAPLPVAQALFAAETEEEPAGRALRFRYHGPLGGAEKRFRLRDDGRLDVTIEAAGGGNVGVLFGPGLRARSLEELAGATERRFVSWGIGDELESLEPRKLGELLRVPGPGLAWVAHEDGYFVAALAPTAPVRELVLEPVLLEAGAGQGELEARPLPAALSKADKALPRSARAYLFAGAEPLQATAIFSAKDYDRLAALPYGLEQTVRWGTFGFLARPLLLALQWIHGNVVGNYGWAIVLLTAALKIALLPLSIAAFKSMRKMQKLSPKMQAIRERWRPKLRDKNGRFNPEAQRAMNEEVMGLYRSEGVNPAGGCLPILVQLPIFLAFYNMLSTAVELKWASWLWVPDLSLPEPFPLLLRPLPLIMGLTQVIQQRMTPPPPDPMQKTMMQMLPIVFTFFSLGFPSGLVLYWLTNNVLTIGQQVVYNRIRDRSEEAEAAAAPPARGKGKRA